MENGVLVYGWNGELVLIHYPGEANERIGHDGHESSAGFLLDIHTPNVLRGLPYNPHCSLCRHNRWLVLVGRPSR